jgi:hypothetical protein
MQLNTKLKHITMTQTQINQRINFIYANFSFVSIRDKKAFNKELVSFGVSPIAMPDIKCYYSDKRTKHINEHSFLYR